MSSVATSRPRARVGGAALQEALGRAVLYVIVIALALLFAMPLIWTVSTSLKTPSELYVFPPQLLPSGLRIENYPKAWNFVPFGAFYWNTAVVTVLGTLGAVVSSCLVATASRAGASRAGPSCSTSSSPR